MHTPIVVAFGKKKTKCDLPCGKDRGTCNIDDNNKQYCQCQTGYIGTLCEIQFLPCPTSDDGKVGTCINGGVCIRDIDSNNKEYYHCGCNVETSDMSMTYATRYCEHSSTIFCVDKEEKDRTSKGGIAKSSFCVNNGICLPDKDINKHHSGCQCPDGYSGAHCEIIPDNIKTVTIQKGISALELIHQHEERLKLQHEKLKKKRHTPISVLGILFALIIGTLMYLIRRGNLNRQPNRRIPLSNVQERAKIPKHLTMRQPGQMELVEMT